MKWRLLAVACVLLALGLLLYPLMGELVSEKYHSDVEAVYTAAIADTDNAELPSSGGRRRSTMPCCGVRRRSVREGLLPLPCSMRSS